MARKEKLTAEELAVIVDHITPLIEGVKRSLDALPARDNAKTGCYVKNQRKYYKRAMAALKWAIETAKQRLEGNGNGGRTPV